MGSFFMSQYRREHLDNKEIYKSLTEIKERTASVETKVDTLVEDNKRIESIKDIAVKARDSSSSAHKRIDSIDKWMFAIGSTVFLAIITAILSLIIIN